MDIDNQTKVIALLSGYVSGLKEGKDYLETTHKTAEQITKLFDADTDEIEELKRLAHEGLPDDCLEPGWSDAKFCSNRQRDGNKCKWCSNYI